MIRSFANKETERIFQRLPVKCSKRLEAAAYEKLLYLHVTETLEDLAKPHGNRLKKLKGDRKGQYSVRVDKQHRICFNWNNGAAENVELVDYH